jgi:N,N-dimethylformamidase
MLVMELALQMKLLAYVSDESYVALVDVAGEFTSLSTGEVNCFRSSATGAFRSDIPDGRYQVTLARDGYGSKALECDIGSAPLTFRLLSNRLVGYVWPKWARGGETGELRLHSADEFQLSLWRYGADKEFIRTISWFDEHGPKANLQILPDSDFSQTGVAWNQHGYPSVPLTHLVDAPARSGLYYFWARTRKGEQFAFPWVVAPQTPQAPIAVLACTNTWNAYNNFGGRSNYINPDGLRSRPTVNARQDLSRYTPPAEIWSPRDDEFRPLSFDRPEPGNDVFDATPWNNHGPADSIEGRMQCGQASGEWRLLAWLEREGLNYDYYADAHLHDGSLQLNRYRTLILPLHPEYWTRDMYLRVKIWVQNGGRLMYLGGNGLNCEVQLNDGTMRCLSHVNSLRFGLGGSVDGDPSIRYDSRMHRTLESEANLLGVACSDAGIMTAAPYRVLKPEHWAFDQTGLATGDLFGLVSLHERIPGGASGHETDKITMHSPDNVEHLAKGENPNGGGADLVYYQNENGGEVFSVGSMTWIACLFSDGAISRITLNVLQRFLR